MGKEMKVAVYNEKGKKVDDIALEPSVFEVKANEAVVHQVVKAQLASSRRGTASTKNRSDVRGGGKKPFRQKGTGRARAGSIRSPLWKGGGVVFGPSPRDYALKTSKKLRRLALKSVLSVKANDSKLIVLDKFTFKKPATKKAKEILANLKVNDKVAVIISDGEAVVKKSLRNLPQAEVFYSSQINPYGILNSKTVIFTKGALEKVTEVLRS